MTGNVAVQVTYKELWKWFVHSTRDRVCRRVCCSYL